MRAVSPRYFVVALGIAFRHSRVIVLILAVASVISLATTSCAMPRQDGDDTAKIRNIEISPSLPPAVVGSSYNGALSVVGGTPPYRFSAPWRTIPLGLRLNSNTGLISGSPRRARHYTFTVFVTDPKGQRGKQRVFLVVHSTPPLPAVSITLSAPSRTLRSGGTEQFSSSVRETSNTAIKWSAGSGRISDSGLFTAPSVKTTQSVLIVATSVADPNAKATVTITVIPAANVTTPPVATKPPTTPAPKPPTTVSSTPPAGTSVPSGADNRYCSAGDQSIFDATDGPANLPQRCINTALSNTPSGGKQISVAAGGNIKSALASAACGDIVTLPAGATFTGPITLPAKNCDAQHWITLRTSAPDSSLPPEGTRVTPCYAGVSSLPARPPLNCLSTANVLAKIQIPNGPNAISVAPGANYYRLIGLEITRQVGTGVASGLIQMSAADHLIFDRDWIHGTALDETTRGIYLGDSTNIAVIDSYLNDFHCVAITGACTDAQTINGGNSLLSTGPYKIVNNFLEAAGENILWGGANGSTVPADIEVRRNHMFKPMIWMPGTPNFIGKSFVVKNLFEIKNAERLLLEANVMEDSWGGFSQLGWGIVMTPRGPWAADRDITIRYNTISHVGGGFQIAATQQQQAGGQLVDSLADERISIHDVTVDDMSASTYNGAGIGFQITSDFDVNKPLNSLSIDHVTMITDPAKTLLVIGADDRNSTMPSNIIFSNSIAVAGMYSVWSDGGKYNGVCAKSGQPMTTFNQCWVSHSVTNNAIIAYPNNEGPWPAGNILTPSSTAVGFTNFNNGNGGNYQLLPSSPYKNMGTPDHKDLGADIETINSEIDGIR